ncbi:class II aldolase/adducin family protein [Bacillus sp. N1-1]|uniref:class II aldolase/adducin family protein n=1 Tax=Bacillus sp. N1-1 TaxID=2682541 RepID=UPI001316E9B8|nr:class II aldolase/adducin family protein [Bacillus sp. N1-1]QHA91192.1 class II aldolase/adducin family protein [Bacillus sp. N1-1]
MNEMLLKKELAYISHKVYGRGLTQATGGNISVRVPGRDAILIKRSGVGLGEVTSEDVLLLSMDGEVIEGFGTPSKEFRFHLGIYQTRPDVNAVVHCHPNYSIGYACFGRELPLPTVTARKILEHVPIAGAAPSGSLELAENVTRLFETYPTIKSCLMEEHGICTVGDSLEKAYNIATLVEDTAKQSFIIEQLKATMPETVINSFKG